MTDELSTVLNSGTHPVDLENGRTIGPGETAEGVDVATPYHRDLVADGHLLVLDGPNVRKRSKAHEPTPPPVPGDDDTKES